MRLITYNELPAVLLLGRHAEENEVNAPSRVDDGAEGGVWLTSSGGWHQ
jgi:hypothetical protein